ncbi:MAG TPA: DNA repair protein RecN [Caldilineae bacterium]|nr:DNA repair protein RecN [Caldilineae bacterium]
MLVELNIRNFAIIEELNLRFSEGLNVLTGETGAGKSIIIDAVSLLLGGRAFTDLIRAGADRAEIEGHFRLGSRARVIQPILEAEGLEGEDDLLILAREVRRSGRNICRVNGRAVALSLLSEIGQYLVDIHGQGEHLSLLRVREHVNLLDRYAGLEAERAEMARLVERLRQVRSELVDLRRDERELARRVDLLTYQVQEITEARLVPGEEEELEAERRRLANAEQLMLLATEAAQVLEEGFEEQMSVIDLLGQVEQALTRLARIDPDMEAMRQQVEDLSYQLADIARDVRDYRDGIEFNPARLAQIEERLDVIHNLKRKYGDSIEEILAFAERAQAELDTITHSEERIAELEAEEERLLREIGELGQRLSQARREAGERLAQEVERELDDLRMEHARFGVDLRWRDDPEGAYVGDRRVAFDATGLDRVEFLISANPGEPLRPLARVASGGETARLMLALKTVLSRADETPTLIFDEIDVGIGGRVGAVVGRKLWGLTAPDVQGRRAHQVLCVTHLPQLAAYGDTHYHVSKVVEGDRTVTRVRELSGDERIEELAAMLGAPTDSGRESTAMMLAEAEAVKSGAHRSRAEIVEA